jgi:hypothetical protein
MSTKYIQSVPKNIHLSLNKFKPLSKKYSPASKNFRGSLKKIHRLLKVLNYFEKIQGRPNLSPDANQIFRGPPIRQIQAYIPSFWYRPRSKNGEDKQKNYIFMKFEPYQISIYGVAMYGVC